MIGSDFGSQLSKQIQRLEIMIAPYRKDFPPVQPHAIQKLAPATFEKLVDPAIAFCLPRKLVNAENTRSRPAAPFLIGKGASETQINDEIPSRSAPYAPPGRVFGMEEENSHDN